MCPDKMTLHGYAALMKGMLTPSVPVPAPERAIFHDNSKSHMHGSVYLLDDIMGGFNNSGRGLIKIECHLVLMTVVRGTVWLVPLFRNRSGNTIYVYIQNGGICQVHYFFTPNLT